MPKDWDEMDMYKQRKLMRQHAEERGIDMDQYQEQDRGSQGNFDWKGLEKEVMGSYENDYDYRRSTEAAKLSGYEGADELSNGLSNLGEVRKTQDFLRGIHENKLENTGKFSSANDYGNVTNYLVNNERSQFKDEMSKSFSDYMEDNKQPESADDSNQQAKPIEYSPALQAAHSRVSEFEKGVGGANNSLQPSVPDGEAETSSDGMQQRNQAAQSFTDDYKLKLMDDLRLS